MSCNGCRVLRKGCSDTCILRPCLRWIESPEAQGHATVFVAKFFGRAGLMGFISAVPENQRPALFQSLLYEACGRTVNPVYGAVGLLWSGNWNVCQAAVETVLKGGALRPAASLPAGSKSTQSPPTRPQTSSPRSKLTIPPEIASVSPLTPDTFLSTNDRSNEDPRNKRTLTDSHNGATERGCTLQDGPQLKRSRNSEQEMKELRSDCGDFHQHPLPALILQPAPWAPKREISSQEAAPNRESPQPSGQLIAPVARRVRPHMDEAEMNDFFRSMKAQRASGEERLAESSENIELALTLHSQAMISSGRMKLGSLRVSSPSTISVNSEGSVTSLDTAELSMTRWPVRTPSPREERDLLHLLT